MRDRGAFAWHLRGNVQLSDLGASLEQRFGLWSLFWLRDPRAGAEDAVVVALRSDTGDRVSSLSFSVPFSITATGLPFDFADRSEAHVNGSASFTSFAAGFPNTTQSGPASFDVDTFFGPFGDQSGMMTFGLVTSGAGSGSVEFNLSTSSLSQFTAFAAAVPEPAVPVQLLIGFTALAGFGLRRLRGVQF